MERYIKMTRSRRIAGLRDLKVSAGSNGSAIQIQIIDDSGEPVFAANIPDVSEDRLILPGFSIPGLAAVAAVINQGATR